MLINSAPTADVQEVKHGKWKERFAFGVWRFDCSFCDDGYATKEKDEILPNYCQNCGAKMDGKEPTYCKDKEDNLRHCEDCHVRVCE